MKKYIISMVCSVCYVAEVGIETIQDFYEYFSMNDVGVQ